MILQYSLQSVKYTVYFILLHTGNYDDDTTTCITDSQKMDL